MSTVILLKTRRMLKVPRMMATNPSPRRMRSRTLLRMKMMFPDLVWRSRWLLW